MNRLRELRIQHGLQLYEVAAIVRRDQSMVARYERGDIRVPDDAKRALAERYGVSVEYLLGWDRNEAPVA